MKSRYTLLQSTSFLICLLLLLLNDFYFKEECHNWLTGKLSDFCGLYVFAVFWSTLFPKQKGLIHLLTAVLFIYWKSPLAQLFIDFFSVHFYSIDRVVDVTDLMALLVLPLSYYNFQKLNYRIQLHPLLVTIVTVFAFGATSVPAPGEIFQPPQYLLFHNSFSPDEEINYPGDYTTYEIDSFSVVAIESIGLSEIPDIQDDFYRIQVIRDLDMRFLKKVYSQANMIFTYQTLLDTLIVKGRHTLRLEHTESIDSLRFYNGRLDGKLRRYNLEGQLVIAGNYDNGIEEGAWTYYNDRGLLYERKTFEFGEMVKTDIYGGGHLVETIAHSTRKKKINNKWFHVAATGLFVLGLLVFQYVMRHKKAWNVDYGYSFLFKLVGASIVLPILTYLLYSGIASFIPNTYDLFFINAFLINAFYLLSLITMYSVLFSLKQLRNIWRILYYVLLFAVILLLIEESVYLSKLMQ